MNAQEIRITTKYFATLREITGKREDILRLRSGSDLKDFLEELSHSYGEGISRYVFDDKGRLRESLSVLINGHAVDTLNLNAIKLSDGDVVVILPPIGGG